MFKIFKWILQALSVPLILVFVWFFDFRPFSAAFMKVDELLTADLAKKVADKNVTPAIYGAIDVAFLTFFYNLFMIVISEFFQKPAKVTIEISDRKSSQPFIAIPFNEESPGTQSPTHLDLKGEIQILYGRWILDHLIRGVRVSIIWDSKWLSIEPQIRGVSDILRHKPGEINFNILDMLSESDFDTSIDGKISVMANSNFKRKGAVGIKLGVNSSSKLVQWCFNWTVSLLVRAELKPCSIMLQKGS